MDELKHNFSPDALPKLEELISCAKNLDAEVPSHTLIYVNEEGYMEKAPGPSAFVNQWIKEFANRKEFYGEEELLEWLKGERDREIRHLKETPKASFQKYYRLLLGVISTEIKAISKEDSEEEAAEDLGDEIQKSIQDLIIADNLAEGMEKLSAFFEDKEEYEDAQMELILHQASFTELMARQRENFISHEDYTRQKVQLRKAILQLLHTL